MQINFQNRTYRVEDPNVCPHCHITNTPHPKWSILTKDTDDIPTFISVWQCSNSKCNKIFVAQHKYENTTFVFKRFLNGLPKGPDWPKPILELKSGDLDETGKPLQSKFIKTYLQSLEAENYGLDEIAGMGYRKAIEYLVKDWAIQNNPEKIEDIKKSWLGKVIKDYYNGDLKEILERATWLGNDQSHYNKLFDEYDIEILKELIDLIMVELDRQYKKEHYIKTIQKRK